MIRILALLVISTLLIAQSFVRDLEDLAQEFAQEFNSGKVAAINKAIAKGWPIMGKNNGQSYELMELALNGLSLIHI